MLLPTTPPQVLPYMEPGPDPSHLKTSRTGAHEGLVYPCRAAYRALLTYVLLIPTPCYNGGSAPSPALYPSLCFCTTAVKVNIAVIAMIVWRFFLKKKTAPMAFQLYTSHIFVFNNRVPCSNYYENENPLSNCKIEDFVETHIFIFTSCV